MQLYGFCINKHVIAAIFWKSMLCSDFGFADITKLKTVDRTQLEWRSCCWRWGAIKSEGRCHVCKMLVGETVFTKVSSNSSQNVVVSLCFPKQYSKCWEDHAREYSKDRETGQLLTCEVFEVGRLLRRCQSLLINVEFMNRLILRTCYYVWTEFSFFGGNSAGLNFAVVIQSELQAPSTVTISSWNMYICSMSINIYCP